MQDFYIIIKINEDKKFIFFNFFIIESSDFFINTNKIDICIKLLCVCVCARAYTHTHTFYSYL